MAIYTFFLTRGDTDAGTFEAIDLPGDEDAAVMASSVLADHPSADHVAIWQGDRPIGEVRREHIPCPHPSCRARSSDARIA